MYDEKYELSPQYLVPNNPKSQRKEQIPGNSSRKQPGPRVVEPKESKEAGQLDSSRWTTT